MKHVVPVITIDGPSGVGKGTLCKALANKLKWNVLDSGAIYRVLAFLALHNKISFYNETKLVLLAKNLNILFILEPNKNILKIFLEGKEISNYIFNELIGNFASKIAILPKVRKTLISFQRSFRINPGLIADGRDMGTVIFPDAFIKIFLDASLKVRAYRRMKQLKKTNNNINLNNFLLKIKERDNRDYNRNISPLLPANNSIFLDSSNLTINEVINKCLLHIKQLLLNIYLLVIVYYIYI